MPLLLVLTCISLLSIRQLSDPDLGFHLKYGKWISEQGSVPQNDLSTYTVGHHPYADLQWGFQWILYQTYRLTGYSGISFLVFFVALIIALLLWLRLRENRVPETYAAGALLCAFLVMEPRITARPEIFSFLLFSVVLRLTGDYRKGRKRAVWLLPLTMVAWCNLHALFVLGLAVILLLPVSEYLVHRKTDRKTLLLAAGCLAVCLINPYGWKGLIFPLQLLTRMDPDNIYHQHIREFIPFFSQETFVVRDYLFLLLAVLYILFAIRKPEPARVPEYLIVTVFGALAFLSVRNLPFFVLLTTPMVTGRLHGFLEKVQAGRRRGEIPASALLILAALWLSVNISTNTYYLRNNSFARTGIGLDTFQQPVRAAAFLTANKMDGRILNSIGFGGWLSWSLPQPVFIDGRLEVMGEELYREITASWQGGLGKLTDRYQPDLIVFNYHKYYPWTDQLCAMTDWRLIYADGQAAIFAREGYARHIPQIEPGAHPGDLTVEAVTPGFWKRVIFPPDFGAADRAGTARFIAHFLGDCREIPHNHAAETYFDLAEQKTRDQDFRSAIALYDSAINLNPLHFKALNNRGILKASFLKDLPGARADFDRAILINSHYPAAWLGRGTVNWLEGNGDKACHDWETAGTLGSAQAIRLLSMHCNR